MTASSRVYTFGGFNINDNPVMRPEQVEHDLRVVDKRCDVAVVCEFRWPSYWKVVQRLLKNGPLVGRGFFPSPAVGAARPNWAAQYVLWDRDKFRKIETKRRLLHGGFKKISESRSLRAALLEDRQTALACWFGVTHFVHGGDEKSDPAKPRGIMSDDLDQFEQFIESLIETKQPIVFQLDANIHKGTWAYYRFRKIVRQHKGRIIGEHGIEFLVVFDRHCHTKVEVTKSFTINALITPHEGRAIEFYLREES